MASPTYPLIDPALFGRMPYVQPPPPVGDIVPYDPDRDPRQQLMNERARATASGDVFRNMLLQGEYPYQAGLERRYQTLGDLAYYPILQGEGGYRPGEREQILRQGELEGLQLTPEERQAAFLTPEEEAAIRGTPRSALDYTNPAALQAEVERGAGEEYGLLGAGASRLRGISGAPGLSLAERYGATQRGTVGSLAGNVRGAIDPTTLGLSRGFAEGYPLTDAEISEASQLAARSSQMPYTASYDEAERRAAASGTQSPMALAALRGRLDRQAAISGAEAAAGTRLQGLAQQREQQRQLEQMRLEAERDISGRKVGAEFGLAETALGTEADIEGRRLGAEQYRAGLGRDIEGELLGQGLATARTRGERALGAEQYSQGLRSGLEQTAEERAAGRGMTLAESRRLAELYGQGERYNRGLTINDLLSNRNRDFAQQRLGQEAEARGYLTGQQQRAGERAGQTISQAIGAEDVTGSRATQAAGMGLQAEELRKKYPSLGERIAEQSLKAAASLAGGG